MADCGRYEQFIEQHINLIFVGGTGTGKTHLVIAIAAQAVRNGSRARFYHLVDLADDLEKEKLAGEGGSILNAGSGANLNAD